MESLKDKFKYAFKGLKHIFNDSAVQIQLCLMCVAIALAIVLRFNMYEMCIVLLCCALVVSSEIINSLLEKVMDFISPDFHKQVEVIKDMSAGMVLFVCILVLIVGIILYGSKVLLLLGGM